MLELVFSVELNGVVEFRCRVPDKLESIAGIYPVCRIPHHRGYSAVKSSHCHIQVRRLYITASACEDEVKYNKI